MKKIIKLEKDDNLTIVNQIFNFDDPTYIYIPIENDLYNINDYLYKNTYINNYLVSISGYIEEVKKINFNNKIVKTLKVANDYKENSEVKIKKQKIKNKEELLNYLKNFKLYTIIDKLNNLNNIESLVISSIDEECYSLNEFMILSNFFKEIMEVINYLMKILSLNNSIIAAKDTDSEAIKKVKSIIGTYPNIKLKLIPDKYLISLKDNLCDYLNLNINNTLILSAKEILILYNTLIKGKITTNQIITISGNNLKKSKIFNVRINTSLKEIIGKDLELIEQDYDLYLNGFLMGYHINKIEDVIITDEIHTIVINKKRIIEETECINCGACYKICPVNINVKKCYDEKKYSKRCLGCGLCNYICPANLKLKEIVKDGEYEEKNY